MRLKGMLGTVQGFTALHRQFEEADFAARSRLEAQRRKMEIENAPPSMLHGHGRLGGIPDASSAKLFDSRGLFLGALNGELLFYNGESHLLTYGKTGTGKGVCAVLPNLAHIRDRSLVVVDVKDGENAFASHRHRLRRLKQRCLFLNPFHLLRFRNTRINPLHHLIDAAKNGHQIDTQADEIALILIPAEGDKGESGWTKKGARRLIALFSEFAALFAPERCTLSGLWSFFNASDEALKVDFISMIECERPGIAGRAAAFNSVFETAVKQWEAYRADAIDALNPFEPGKSLAAATDGHEFDMGRLKVKPHTVYIVTPSEKLGVAAPWISLIVNYMIEAIARRPGKVRTTFLLDEFPQLPAAPAVMKAFRLYRGRGISLWLFCQGRYSMAGRWSENEVREFEDQCAVLQMWAVDDPSLTRDITLWSGTKTIRSLGVSHGGGVVETAGANLGEASRAVLQSEDIRALG